METHAFVPSEMIPLRCDRCGERADARAHQSTPTTTPTFSPADEAFLRVVEQAKGWFPEEPPCRDS